MQTSEYPPPTELRLRKQSNSSSSLSSSSSLTSFVMQLHDPEVPDLTYKNKKSGKKSFSAFFGIIKWGVFTGLLVFFCLVFYFLQGDLLKAKENKEILSFDVPNVEIEQRTSDEQHSLKYDYSKMIKDKENELIKREIILSAEKLHDNSQEVEKDIKKMILRYSKAKKHFGHNNFKVLFKNDYFGRDIDLFWIEFLNNEGEVNGEDSVFKERFVKRIRPQQSLETWTFFGHMFICRDSKLGTYLRTIVVEPTRFASDNEFGTLETYTVSQHFTKESIDESEVPFYQVPNRMRIVHKQLSPGFLENLAAPNGIVEVNLLHSSSPRILHSTGILHHDELLKLNQIHDFLSPQNFDNQISRKTVESSVLGKVDVLEALEKSVLDILGIPIVIDGQFSNLEVLHFSSLRKSSSPYRDWIDIFDENNRADANSLAGRNRFATILLFLGNENTENPKVCFPKILDSESPDKVLQVSSKSGTALIIQNMLSNSGNMDPKAVFKYCDSNPQDSSIPVALLRVWDPYFISDLSQNQIP